MRSRGGRQGADGDLRVQLVLEGSTVNLLKRPKSGGIQELRDASQMRNVMSQAPRMVSTLR